MDAHMPDISEINELSDSGSADITQLSKPATPVRHKHALPSDVLLEIPALNLIPQAASSDSDFDVDELLPSKRALDDDPLNHAASKRRKASASTDLVLAKDVDMLENSAPAVTDEEAVSANATRTANPVRQTFLSGRVPADKSAAESAISGPLFESASRIQLRMVSPVSTDSNGDHVFASSESSPNDHGNISSRAVAAYNQYVALTRQATEGSATLHAPLRISLTMAHPNQSATSKNRLPDVQRRYPHPHQETSRPVDRVGLEPTTTSAPREDSSSRTLPHVSALYPQVFAPYPQSATSHSIPGNAQADSQHFSTSLSTSGNNSMIVVPFIVAGSEQDIAQHDRLSDVQRGSPHPRFDQEISRPVDRFGLEPSTTTNAHRGNFFSSLTLQHSSASKGPPILDPPVPSIPPRTPHLASQSHRTQARQSANYQPFVAQTSAYHQMSSAAPARPEARLAMPGIQAAQPRTIPASNPQPTTAVQRTPNLPLADSGHVRPDMRPAPVVNQAATPARTMPHVPAADRQHTATSSHTTNQHPPVSIPQQPASVRGQPTPGAPLVPSKPSEHLPLLLSKLKITPYIRDLLKMFGLPNTGLRAVKVNAIVEFAAIQSNTNAVVDAILERVEIVRPGYMANGGFLFETQGILSRVLPPAPPACSFAVSPFHEVVKTISGPTTYDGIRYLTQYQFLLFS